MTRPIMNRAFVLEAPARTPDGAGGFVEHWMPLGTIWGELTPGAGRERGQDHATLSRVAYRITTRAAAPGAPSRPTPNQRFKLGGRLFRIEAVTERGPDALYLTCHCIEETVA
ncbi:MAG: head-tail adaptor protein [Shimia sp.]